MFSAPDQQLIMQMVEANPDAILLDAPGCDHAAIALRRTGYEGRILYAYPSCRVLDTTLPNDARHGAISPECHACRSGEVTRAWLDGLRPGDLFVATSPIPGVADSDATRRVLDYIADMAPVAWHHGWGADMQRRIDGWLLGWYAETLLRGAQEVERRFPDLRLPVRLRVLIAAYHLETPHPLYDTTVSTRVGDPRLTRDLWWYDFDREALLNGQPFLEPLPDGPLTPEIAGTR